MSSARGAIISSSSKQKLNTRSSTEAELVAADDFIGKLLWMQRFLKAQGYSLRKNILLQDNKSAILLETKGRSSLEKRSRALQLRHFFITDCVNRGEVEVEYCPTEKMAGDFFTKPLQGNQFHKFRKLILGMEKNTSGVGSQYNSTRVSVRGPSGIIELGKTHVFIFNSTNVYLFALMSQYVEAPVIRRRLGLLAVKLVGGLSSSAPPKLAAACEA